MQRIILVSNKKEFLKRNEQLLQTWGFGLLTANSGAEVLAHHREQPLDLVFADYELEDMSGCALCSLFKAEEHTRRVPLILASHNVPQNIEAVMSSGACAIVLKPIDPVQLLEAIGRFIGRQLVRDKRVPLKVEVHCRQDGLAFDAISQDISTSGVLLETRQQLPPESRIGFRFELPDGGPVDLEGEVRRQLTVGVGRYRYGIKFSSPPPDYLQVIGNYVTVFAKLHDLNTTKKAVDFIRPGS